jgi:hypothetical protein
MTKKTMSNQLHTTELIAHISAAEEKNIDNHGAYTLSLPPMHKGNEKQYKQVDPNSKQ